MGVVNSNKDTIDCGVPFNVKLSITATPDIVNNPTDIVLVLDRSGSMSGSPLLNLKNGAKKFVEIIDKATDSSGDVQIGNGSRIGIVSFSSTATKDNELITSVAELDTAINVLSAGDLYMDFLGRILELSAIVKNVCPNRRVALAVMLTEVDQNDIEHKRGMKTMVIPAHSRFICLEVKVNCIKFVLSEELDVSGIDNAFCNNRKFKARFITNYIDNDFCCCDDLNIN